jgi:hypothetical protein
MEWATSRKSLQRITVVLPLRAITAPLSATSIRLNARARLQKSTDMQ